MMRRAAVVPPLPAHQIDQPRLFAYLEQHLENFTQPATLGQFRGGQSNPTYLIETAESAYVLRKKPPGILLPSAHQIDREYRIQRALLHSSVPVAPMLHFCTDPSIIGTEFYVMAYLDGRILHDPMLRDLSAADRAPAQTAVFEAIGALHATDYQQVGLADYGRPTNYLPRQLHRWSRQYATISTESLTSMTSLIAWLERNIPAADETSIVHGDFRLGNMMLHADEPRLIAVLDWELSTLGHPLADLAYSCMMFHMPRMEGSAHSGYAGLDLAANGMLNELQCLQVYCRRTGRHSLPDWNFHLGFAFFRAAAIAEGVYVRALAGNAADPSGIDLHKMSRISAEQGWAIVNRPQYELS